MLGNRVALAKFRRIVYERCQPVFLSVSPIFPPPFCNRPNLDDLPT